MYGLIYKKSYYDSMHVQLHQCISKKKIKTYGKKKYESASLNGNTKVHLYNLKWKYIFRSI